MSDLAVTFRAEVAARPAAAVFARGKAAAALLDRLLARPDLAELTGVAGSDVVVVLGPEARLPWVEGAVYLGPDPLGPGVYLPTAWQPNVPVDLFAAAVRERVGSAALPVAWVPEEAAGVRCVVPLALARPLRAVELKAARGEWR